jgi:hypothetical protein
VRFGVVLSVGKTNAFVEATGTTPKHVSRPRSTLALSGARMVSGTPFVWASRSLAYASLSRTRAFGRSSWMRSKPGPEILARSSVIVWTASAARTCDGLAAGSWPPGK